MYEEVMVAHKFRLSYTLLLSFLGIKIIGTALVLLFKFAKKLEANEFLRVMSIEVNPRELHVLISVSVLFSFLLIIGVVLEYLSSINMARLSAQIHFELINKLERRFGRKITKVMPISSYRTYNRLFNSIKMKDTRKAALSVRKIPDFFVGCAIFLVGLTVLMRLQIGITLCLIFVFIVLAPFYFKISQKTSHAIREAPLAMGGYRKSLVEFSKHRSEISGSYSKDHFLVLENAKMRVEETFVGRFRSMAKVKMLSQITLALVGGGALTYLSSVALTGRISWLVIGAYLVALRLTFSGLTKASTTANFMLRFYPSIERLALSFGDSETKIQIENLQIRDEIKISVNKKIVKKLGLDQESSLVAGRCYFFLSKAKPKRSLLHYFSEALSQVFSVTSSKLVQVMYVLDESNVFAGNMSIEENFNLKFSLLEETISQEALEDIYEKTGNDPCKKLEREDWSRLKDETKWEIILYSMADKCQLFILPSEMETFIQTSGYFKRLVEEKRHYFFICRELVSLDSATDIAKSIVFASAGASVVVFATIDSLMRNRASFTEFANSADLRDTRKLAFELGRGDEDEDEDT
jgi:hypothetical protein